MKLLLVEDEKLLSKSIAKGLTMLGYAVDCAYDGEEALYLYELNEYDLMILDLNLPKLDGMEVLRRIRAQDADFRILILSARNSLDDKITGLDSGSNDYLTKPFEFAELEARIRSLLRRDFTTRDTTLRCGALSMDTAARRVLCGGKEIELTRKEYALLEYLMTHAGRVVSAEELIEHAWDSEKDLFSNSFRFHIHSLRKKLEAAGAGDYIVTQRGQGYRIQNPEEKR
ncbi:response regulator transcription factor [Christensenella intestinihominis]|uniref:response regulator transcription factor n=1 Tax=Christensenella intestinihominis TaxID=1851429 RepID=UPI00082AAA2E|nr:response regulator transcription factor [Christensenella intestinihominis]